MTVLTESHRKDNLTLTCKFTFFIVPLTLFMDASPQASPQISKLSLSQWKSIFPQNSAKGISILKSLHQLRPSEKPFCSHIYVCVNAYVLRPCKLQNGVTGRLWLNLEYGTRRECHIVNPVIVQQWQNALYTYCHEKNVK